MNLKYAVSFILIGLVPLGLLYAQMPDYKGSYGILREAKQAQFNHPRPDLIAADSSHNYDVIIYKLLLSLNNHLLFGSVEIGLEANINNLSIIELDYLEGTVDSIKSGNYLLNFSRSSGTLTAHLPSPINGGDSTGIKVFYHTSPSKGFYWQTNNYGGAVWYSFAELANTRYWFPCYDQPWDKALSDIEVDLPANMYCTGNGSLIGQWQGPGANRMTYHWRENYPVSTYLISLCACDYAIISSSVQIHNNQLPLIFYVYHRDSTKAANDLANAPAMLQYYSDILGDYGFIDEKYAISECKLNDGWGSKGHQTNTSLGEMLITGDKSYEWIYAHELASQWFGDLVTAIDRRNIWLGEGTATYLDALFTEHFYGETAFRDRLSNFKTSYLWEDSNDLRYAIYNPPESHLFGSAEYEKAALVLHMLRYISGDDAFFVALRRYVTLYKYGNASTDDLRSIFEAVTGQNLDWFFNEWIYSAGHPKYKIGWTTQPFTNKYNLQIQIKQIQSNAPYFEMPLPILVHSSLKDTLITIDVPAQYNYHASVLLDFNPTNIIIDPDNWILKEYSILNPPDYVSDLFLFADTIRERLEQGDIDTVSLIVGNAGSSNLIYSATSESAWLTVNNNPETLLPGGIGSLPIIINSPDLAASTYQGTINITSNDPNPPNVQVMIILTVLGNQYLPGDANGSGRVDGADVTFTVRYLKGIGLPPSPLLAGDANGDCQVRGSDVTYVVRYLKGIGPAPIGGDCR